MAAVGSVGRPSLEGAAKRKMRRLQTFPPSSWNGEVRPKAALRRHRLPADTEADALKGLKELWSIPVIGFGKRDPLMELTQCRKW